MKIAEKVKEFFHNEGIHSTTIQPEFTEVVLQIHRRKRINNSIYVSSQLPTDESASETESTCALDCPAKDRTCAASTCCGPSKQVPVDSPLATAIPAIASGVPSANPGDGTFHVNLEHAISHM